MGNVKTAQHSLAGLPEIGISSSILSCEQLSTAIEMTGMGLWRWDAESDEFSFDHQACRIHGFDMKTQSCQQRERYLCHVYSEDQGKLQVAWEQIQNATFSGVEYRYVLADGSVKWISCSGSGDQTGVIGGLFDISKRKFVDEQLITAQKMEAVGQLTAGIAHNFNNILSAILPNLHLAARYTQPGGVKFIRNAKLAAERAVELVSELMTVAGRREADAKKEIDLYEISERVVRICRTTFGAWVHLVFDVEDDIPLVLGNEGQLEQVLLNLLINARDSFTDVAVSCPRISVELELTPEDESATSSVVLRVSDNGPGIGEEVQKRVFEPFFTTKKKGTGLGLATALAIVSDHEGSLSVASEIDCGTCFEMVLPVAKDD